MGFEMTPESLKKLCRELKLYSSCPELNDVLHLQQKGIVKIQSLEKYTGLKTIYLECNAISLIEGLDHLKELRCLYLNQNLVEHVSGLENLRLLETLDLADNQIKTVQGLSGCISLRQLNLSGNRIRNKADVEHLLECPSLTSLDISKNRIEDEDALKLIRSLHLSLLRLCGNPVLSKTWCYRKSTVSCMPLLNYLDDSPVFEKERRLAYGWVEGGTEAEKMMREAIKQEEADQRAYHHKAFQDMIQKARAEAAARKQQEEADAAAMEENARMEEETQKRIKEEEVLKDDVKMSDIIVILEEPNNSNKRDGSELNLEEDKSPAKLIKTEDFMELDIHNHHKDSVLSGENGEEKLHEQMLAEQRVNEELKLREKMLAEQRLKWQDKEKEFKRQLHEKMLQRAATEAVHSSTAAMSSHERPVIWGTRAYRELWTAAANINSQELTTDKGSDEDEICMDIDGAHGEQQSLAVN